MHAHRRMRTEHSYTYTPRCVAYISILTLDWKDVEPSGVIPLENLQVQRYDAKKKVTHIPLCSLHFTHLPHHTLSLSTAVLYDVVEPERRSGAK